MLSKCGHRIVQRLNVLQKNTNTILGIARSQRQYATNVEEVTFQTKQFRLHNIDEGPSTTVSLKRADALEFYTDMHTIRRMEASAGNMYKEKIVRGFCHLYSGQEAVAVGIKSCLRANDSVITAYRAHGWTYLMGIPVESVLGELAGKSLGCSRGKGGSMHMYAPHFYGGNGIVGSQVPLGVGLALASKYRGDGSLTVACYGDGAANQGQIFEVFNIAKLWSLPCIFVCENNGYGMGTSAERASANTAYYTRGDVVPGIWIDGMDVLAVREATRYAVEHCTSGKGPILLEAATYRYHGHSMSDPGTSYRTREEVQEVRQTRDPITSFKEKITSSGLVTLDEIKKVDAEIRGVVDAATKKAKSSKEVDMSEMTANIYAHNLHTGIRNVDPFTPLQHKHVPAE